MLTIIETGFPHVAGFRIDGKLEKDDVDRMVLHCKDKLHGLEASGDDVLLLTGCVMDAWQREVHVAVMQVIEATGVGVRPTAGAASRQLIGSPRIKTDA